jgi:hypothetical protein
VSAERRFDPLGALRVLTAHDVHFVVIGGYASVLHGSALFTYDADVCPARDAANLTRLCGALAEMQAHLRVANETNGVEFSCSDQFLAQMRMLNLTTTFGDFDVSLRPAGSGGYEDLIRHAVEFDVGGFVVSVASLDDIIHSKEIADRAKDRAALPHLYALRDEIARRSDSA